MVACCREVVAGVDRLEHGRDLPHLGRGHVAAVHGPFYQQDPLEGEAGLWHRRCGFSAKYLRGQALISAKAVAHVRPAVIS